MKKFLSLVLALVMTMSLVTISAGAKDFTDAASIDYKEAVGVMSELKIVDGDTTGAFNPEGKLTRGAAAKIICNMILGPTTAAALHTTTAPFPDVPADHVFAGYIAYCVEQGIISGYTDGTFKPANPLTGYAFLKMLLGALGYDQYTEGYAVPNWSVNVAKQAIAIGLDDGNDDFDGTKIVTREEALLYAFNTMKATMVDYSSKTEVNTGNAVVTISGSRYELASNVDYNGVDDDKMQFVEKYFSKVELDSDDTDAFGRLINTWTNGKKDLGSYLKTPDAKYTGDVKEKTIYADLDLDTPYDFEVMVDGEDNNLATFTVEKKNNGPVDSIADATAGIVGNGSDIYVYLNEDETEGRIVVVNTYIMDVTDDYNDKKETLPIAEVADGTPNKVNYDTASAGTYVLETEDWAGLDKYTEGDYMLVTMANGVIKSIAKAEPTVATVTEYVHGESVTAGGEEYKYSAASNHRNDAGDTYSYKLKEEAKLYLDEDGYVLYEKSEAAADKYLYVAEFSADSNATRAAADAYAYFVDGTEAELKVSKIEDVKVYASDVNWGDNTIAVTGKTGPETAGRFGAGWYAYTEKNGKYELKAVAQTGNVTATQTDNAGTANVNEAAIVDYSYTHTEITDGTTTLDGTKLTNFIIIEPDDDLKVYTGIKNVPDIFAGTGTIVNMITTKAPYANYVFIDVAGGTIEGDSNATDDVIFLLKKDARGNDADDDGYYRYKALVNGEEKTIRYDEDIAGAGNGALKLWTDIEFTSKTYIEDATEVTGAVAANRDDFSKATVATNGTVTVTGNTIEIGGGTENDYFMADEYTIYVIETDGTYDTYTMNQLKRVENLLGDTVYGVLNADAEYTALYIVRN